MYLQETAIVSPPLTKCPKPEKFDLVQSTLYLLKKKDQEKRVCNFRENEIPNSKLIQTDTLQDDAHPKSTALKKPPIKRKATAELS